MVGPSLGGVDTNTGYTVPGLHGGDDYRLSVQACNANGCSGWTSTMISVDYPNVVPASGSSSQ